MPKRTHSPVKTRRAGPGAPPIPEVEVLASAGTVSAADDLAAMAASDNAALAKAARRALHALACRGVFPSPAVSLPVVVAPRQPVRGTALMTTHVRGGGRILAITTEDAPRRVTVFMLESGGWIRAVTTRKETIGAFAADLTTRLGDRATVADAPFDLAAHRVHGAARRTSELGHMPPMGLSDALAALEPLPPPPTPHPAYGMPRGRAPVLTVSGEMRRTRQAVLAPLAYALATQRLAPWVEQVAAARSSPIVLANHQREEALGRIFGAAVDALVSPADMVEAIAGMEDDALIYRLTGRHEHADCALAAAEAGRRATAPRDWPELLLGAELAIVATLADGSDEPDDDEEEPEHDARIIRLDR